MRYTAGSVQAWTRLGESCGLGLRGFLMLRTVPREMAMKAILPGLTILLLVLAGCDSKRVEALQAELESANKKVEANDAKIAVLEAAWKKFEQGFDAEKRNELDKSITAMEEKMQRVEKDSQQAAGVLQEVKGLEKEIKKLRDLCAKHEAESKDANLIGQVRESVEALAQRIRKVESSGDEVTSLRSKIRSLESDVRGVENDIRSVKSKVR